MLRLAALLVALAVAGCATAVKPGPDAPVPGEYEIPVVKRDGHVEHHRIGPLPEETMLFCIETNDQAVCIAEDAAHRAEQFVFPLGEEPKPEKGARWDGEIFRYGMGDFGGVP